MYLGKLTSVEVLGKVSLTFKLRCGREGRDFKLHEMNVEERENSMHE